MQTAVLSLTIDLRFDEQTKFSRLSLLFEPKHDAARPEKRAATKKCRV